MGRFLKRFACGLLAALGLAVAALAEAPRLIAGFLKTDIHPGELVEFEAKIAADTVTTFEFKLPASALLVPITREVGPVQFADGHFFQVQRHVFQAAASGTVRWESIGVKVVQAGTEQAYPLPAVTLRIVPYAAADASDLPQTLPAPEPVETQSTGSGRGWVLVGLAVLAVCGGIGWVWKRGRARR